MRSSLAAIVVTLSALWLGAAVSGGASKAKAAVLIALDLPALVSRSDHVIVAKAETESSRYAEGLIVTDVQLRVIAKYKGSAAVGSTLIATHLGGSVDRVGLRVPGAAHFVLGRSAIVFLRQVAHSEELNVTGMSQGVMPILGEGSEAQVQVGGNQSTLMQQDAQGSYVPAAKQSRRQTLASVLAEIERLTGQ